MRKSSDGSTAWWRRGSRSSCDCGIYSHFQRSSRSERAVSLRPRWQTIGSTVSASSDSLVRLRPLTRLRINVQIVSWLMMENRVLRPVNRSRFLHHSGCYSDGLTSFFRSSAPQVLGNRPAIRPQSVFPRHFQVGANISIFRLVETVSIEVRNPMNRFILGHES